MEFVNLRALWSRAPTGFSCFRALPSRANLRVLGLGLLWPLWGPLAWKPGVLDFEPWWFWGPRACCGAWDPRASCGACLRPGPVEGPGSLGPRASAQGQGPRILWLLCPCPGAWDPVPGAGGGAWGRCPDRSARAPGYKTYPKLIQNLSKTYPKPITYPKLIQNLSKTYPKLIQNL